ncbi:MAG TPA: RNA methyltransferase [Mesorhizobium sp.]|nr:RNA methyltransferase [Mesorhizobium sp.]
MPRIIRIDDAADPRLAPYENIRERDLVGRRERFIAEGKVVLGILARSSRFSAESVLLLESRLAGAEGILALLPPDAPVYVVPPAVMDRVAGFSVHRGVLAVGRKPPPGDAKSLLEDLPARALVLALVGISNHDNMGALFRNAAAFGVSAVLTDSTSCDPLYRKAIRVGVGAALKIPFAALPSPEALLSALDMQGFEHLALSPGGAADIRTLSRPPRLALWLGAEGPGLPESLLRRLPTARIPLAEGWDSLNVATAAAVALHRFSEV